MRIQFPIATPIFPTINGRIFEAFCCGVCECWREACTRDRVNFANVVYTSLGVVQPLRREDAARRVRE